MSDIQVSEVSGSGDLNAFVKMAWTANAGDPAWVPPLVMDRKDFLNRKKHPFYEHGDAALYLARRGDAVVGRILVSDDPRYNDVQGTNLGTFGMFECIDDEAVAHALLDRAAEWCRARGRDSIWGPVDYSTNNQCGLLVEGFETPPRILMNHNPPYYAGLLESWGLAKAKDLYAFWVTDEMEIPERWRRIAGQAARRGGITIRPANMKDFASEVQRIKTLYNEAWEDNWGFVKMTDHEFDHLAKDLKLLVVPDLLLIAEKNGEAVGFSMSLPDINEALSHLKDGKLTTFGLPIGLGKLLYYQKQIKTIRLITLGIKKSARRLGIAEQLIIRTSDVARKLGYTACEMGWTLEDNDLINRPIEALGSEKYKTFRIYEKALS